MTTDLVATPGRAIRTAEDRELIKNTVARGVTDNELALFIKVCEHTGLDPFAKQIYAIRRRTKQGDNWVDVMGIQTSIDGFRLIAQRTNHYQGQLGPWWCDETGNWTDVWLSDKYPAAARVAVMRDDFTQPLYAVATWKSYVQMTGDRVAKMWQQMPDVMIAKCAEALALRRAFPQELSGLYTEDELGQAENDTLEAGAVVTRPQAAPAPTTAAPTTEPGDVNSLSLKDLTQALIDANLPLTGSKKEKIARLLQHRMDQIVDGEVVAEAKAEGESSDSAPAHDGAKAEDIEDADVVPEQLAIVDVPRDENGEPVWGDGEQPFV